MQTNFTIESSIYQAVEHLTVEQKGKLFDAIFCYCTDREFQLSADLLCPFIVIKQSIDKAEQKTTLRAEINRQNVNKRWKKERALRALKNSDNSELYICKKVKL